MTTRTLLNPEYTFENFIIYEGNLLAVEACKSVAASPGSSYNPLYIYGGKGLGKTHLLHAIGNRVSHDSSHNRNLKVVYVTSKNFTAELIKSLGERTMVEFKENYRNIDVLLIDDIQFLINKERTQEEFFYTFNELYEAQKQIVIVSNRSPRATPALHNRLRSRFEWGLTADISYPDLETRETFLKTTANMEKTSIPGDVINYIATKAPSNRRGLEGALKRVIAYASYYRKKITIELAKEALRGMLLDSNNTLLTPEIIQEKVSDYFDIPQNFIAGDFRLKEFLYPRQIAMYLAAEILEIPHITLAQAFNRKDHKAASRALRKINEILRAGDADTLRDIENIRNSLMAGGVHSSLKTDV